MNGLVTTYQFDNIIDIPVLLPQTEIRAQDSLVICSVKLLLGQTLCLGYMACQLVQIDPGDAIKANSSLGLAYVGIFAGGFESLRTPSGTPINFVSMSGPQISVLSPYNQRNFAGPDIVEIVVVNNTDLNMEVAVTGTAKLILS